MQVGAGMAQVVGANGTSETAVLEALVRFNYDGPFDWSD